MGQALSHCWPRASAQRGAKHSFWTPASCAEQAATLRSMDNAVPAAGAPPQPASGMPGVPAGPELEHQPPYGVSNLEGATNPLGLKHNTDDTGSTSSSSHITADCPPWSPEQLTCEEVAAARAAVHAKLKWIIGEDYMEQVAAAHEFAERHMEEMIQDGTATFLYNKVPPGTFPEGHPMKPSEWSAPMAMLAPRHLQQ